jgi:hypothetical protein
MQISFREIVVMEKLERKNGQISNNPKRRTLLVTIIKAYRLEQRYFSDTRGNFINCDVCKNWRLERGQSFTPGHQ